MKPALFSAGSSGNCLPLYTHPLGYNTKKRTLSLFSNITHTFRALQRIADKSSVRWTSKLALFPISNEESKAGQNQVVNEWWSRTTIWVFQRLGLPVLLWPMTVLLSEDWLCYWWPAIYICSTCSPTSLGPSVVNSLLILFFSNPISSLPPYPMKISWFMLPTILLRTHKTPC